MDDQNLSQDNLVPQKKKKKKVNNLFDFQNEFYTENPVTGNM